MAKKNLMIVESPAKAKTIEKYLGEDFVVKASYGHVRDLPKADDAIDIEKGFEPKYIVLADKKEVIKELKGLAKGAETVWLATDEDREGEAISWHLAEVLGLDPSNAKRVVFNEITKKAVVSAVENPRLINIDLVNAQQARRVLDRLVGFKLSPILWSKVRTGLSAGRVQSVAVRLVVERERDIQAFKSESSFRIQGNFDVAKGAKLKADLRKRPKDEKVVQDFLQSCIGASFIVKSLETRPGKRSPAAPFTTSTLQQEASRKLGFSVLQTMRVAQTLYEQGFITYMRTDSVNLSGFAMAAAEDAIKNRYGDNYHKARQYKGKNSNSQEAHEAIRPTDMALSDVPGERNEQRLYELIWKRTIASQMEDAIMEKTTVSIGVSTNAEEFVARGEVIKFDGFLKVYMESVDDEDDDEDDSSVLPPMTVGQELDLIQIVARQRFSKHPPRYAEASLVKKMEELGIGRPSTYAPTISTIQKRNYATKETRDGVEREYTLITLSDSKIENTTQTEITGAEKAKLFPTDLGMLVTDFLTEHFPKVLDYSFTASVEQEFDEIATGARTWNNMIGQFYDDFSVKVKDTKENAERVGKERELGVHPKNGLVILARFGKYGPFVQLGPTPVEDDDPKPKYASLRKDQLLDTVTLEDALELFKMPRDLGESEGLKLRVNIGRFGPYVQLGKEFFSIPKGEDPYEVSVTRALEIIEEKREIERNKLIKQIADDIQVLNGRWGPYVKMRGKNLKIAKDVEPKSLTLEDCEKMFLEQKDKPKGRRGASKAKAKPKAKAKAKAKPKKK